jgi:hypothetical protein
MNMSSKRFYPRVQRFLHPASRGVRETFNALLLSTSLGKWVPSSGIVCFIGRLARNTWRFTAFNIRRVT